MSTIQQKYLGLRRRRFVGEGEEEINNSDMRKTSMRQGNHWHRQHGLSEKAAIQVLFALPKLPWDKTVKRWFPPLQVKPSNGAAKPLSTYFRSFQNKKMRRRMIIQ